MVVLGVMVAAASLVAGPSRAGDEGNGPHTLAFARGEAGCTSVPPVGPNDCDFFEETVEPGSLSSWQIDNEAGLTITGASMAAQIQASFVEINQADGSLGSLTISATIEASMISGGRGAARLEISGFYPVNAQSVSVIGSAAVEGHGTALVGGDGTVEVEFGCEEDPAVNVRVHALGGAHGGEQGRRDDESASTQISEQVPVVPHQGRGGCTLRVFMDVSAGANRPIPPTEDGSGRSELSLTLLAAGDVVTPSPSPAECDLAGTVRDGVMPADKHANPIVGAKVELFRAGSVLAEVATDAAGRYCFSSDLEAAQYDVQVSLVDALHDPPIFHVEHSTEAQPIEVTREITEDEFGRSDLDIAYGSESGRPWLPDVANVFWESQRFIDWLTNTAAIDPAGLTGLKIVAFSGAPNRYTPFTKTATVNTVQSPLDRQENPFANAPENAEWHEIGHHLGDVLGVAKFSSFACLGQTNHGGWQNGNTCDSLAEGMPVFLSVLASLDLDADRGGGYGIPFYASLYNIEGNDYSPWSVDAGSNGQLAYREDLAVASLLWDLADATPNETELMTVEARGTGDTKLFTARDRVALTGLNLIHQLSVGKPDTVADLYDFLMGEAVIDSALRALDVDVDGDGSMDASAIDEIFLMHNFRSFSRSSYVVGEPISHTPPGKTQSLSDRRDTPFVPGAAVRLGNTGSGVATFTIEITSPAGGADEFEIQVAPSSELVLPVQLPPYYDGTLPESGELPACGGPNQKTLTLQISAPGATRQTLDSCDYLHRVVAATDGVALTVEAQGTETVPTAAPTPTDAPIAPAPMPDGGLPVVAILAIFVVLALVIAGVAFFVLRRRPT